MKDSIFIAGAGGYIGCKLVESLLTKNKKVIALDRFFFGDTLNHLSQHKNLLIVKDDIRYFDKKLLTNTSSVINLAAISNDPASELNPKITKQINDKGALRLAKLAKEAKVQQYIFLSSCSVYGHNSSTVHEESPLLPLSEYAKTKIQAEKKILAMTDNRFAPTILRLATVYGLSTRRMRFDLIINIMTLHAWKHKKIYIVGGGQQWRPLIHIDDVISAIEMVLDPLVREKVTGQVFNIGSNDQNYQVSRVAQLMKQHFPDLVIEPVPSDPENRSYRVDFSKAKRVLGFRTKKTIEDGIGEIRTALEKGEVTDSTHTITLKHYQYLMEAERIMKQVKLRNKLF